MKAFLAVLFIVHAAEATISFTDLNEFFPFEAVVSLQPDYAPLVKVDSMLSDNPSEACAVAEKLQEAEIEKAWKEIDETEVEILRKIFKDRRGRCFYNPLDIVGTLANPAKAFSAEGGPHYSSPRKSIVFLGQQVDFVVYAHVTSQAISSPLKRVLPRQYRMKQKIHIVPSYLIVQYLRLLVPRLQPIIALKEVRQGIKEHWGTNYYYLQRSEYYLARMTDDELERITELFFELHSRLMNPLEPTTPPNPRNVVADFVNDSWFSDDIPAGSRYVFFELLLFPRIEWVESDHPAKWVGGVKLFNSQPAQTFHRNHLFLIFDDFLAADIPLLRGKIDVVYHSERKMRPSPRREANLQSLESLLQRANQRMIAEFTARN